MPEVGQHQGLAVFGQAFQNLSGMRGTDFCFWSFRFFLVAGLRMSCDGVMALQVYSQGIEDHVCNRGIWQNI